MPLKMGTIVGLGFTSNVCGESNISIQKANTLQPVATPNVAISTNNNVI